MSSLRTPEDYTVGWICVKPENEATAARAMLDERHGYIDPAGYGDQITYFGGKIGQHNVVIGCSGEAGLIPANNIATNMMRSFKNIKFGLLCGIGGGNPHEKHDVRLGDIVVGMPDGQHSGIIQYNIGKATEDGLERRSSHNRPPQFLMQAIHNRKTDMLEGFDVWQTHLKKVREDRGSLKGLTDILHEGDKEICRPDNRESKVHYGLIASGDLVIKADKKRTELVEQIHDEVLCFEMEAAGLVNTFPCLVVRGISDYCDRYKNDDWQPYASSAAAAYCKYLLGVVRASDIQGAPTAKRVTALGGLRYHEPAHGWTLDLGLMLSRFELLSGELTDDDVPGIGQERKKLVKTLNQLLQRRQMTTRVPDVIPGGDQIQDIIDGLLDELGSQATETHTACLLIGMANYFLGFARSVSSKRRELEVLAKNRIRNIKFRCPTLDISLEILLACMEETESDGLSIRELLLNFPNL